jgi:hypothetical protein
MVGLVLDSLVRLLCFAWLLSLISTSQASQLPSVISLETGGDDNGGAESYLDLDYNLKSGHHLLASLASNRTHNNDVSIKTKTVLLGFQSNPLKVVSGGIEAEHWGERGTLITDTVRLKLDINQDLWLMSIRPQWRTLTITTNATIKPEVEVNSQGAAIDLTIFTSSPWSFSLGYAKHDYDRKIEDIPKYPVFFAWYLSAATLDLANGFEKYRNSIGINYATARTLWTFSRLKSVSQVTSTATYINTLRCSVEINRSWRLRARAGNQLTENDSNVIAFAGIGLAYSW